MAGIGTMKLGTGPFGVGTPTAGAVPPTGDFGVRYVNPASRDYQLDPVTGQQQQSDETLQRTVLALLMEEGSSAALPNMGIRLPRKITEGVQKDVELAVAKALRQLTDVERRIRIEEVAVARVNPRRVDIKVTFRNLLTGLTESVTRPF